MAFTSYDTVGVIHSQEVGQVCPDFDGHVTQKYSPLIGCCI